jgi:hypothetical protein
MAFEITGKVIDIAPVNQVSDKFKKREFVIEKKEAGGSAVFIDYIKFQLVQDKCDLINESFMNEEVKVMFNIKGNKWERDGKVNYFTNLDAWKVERVQMGTSNNQSVPPQSTEDIPTDVNDLDDLPF